MNSQIGHGDPAAFLPEAIGESAAADGVILRAQLVETHWDSKVLVELVTDAGAHVLFTSTAEFVWDLNPGDRVRITGTVGEHDQHAGVDQTWLRAVRLA